MNTVPTSRPHMTSRRERGYHAQELYEQYEKQWKEDHTPVTETDIGINEIVLAEIKSRYPEHSILRRRAMIFPKTASMSGSAIR